MCSVDVRNAELEFMFHFEGDVDASGEWIDEGTFKLCLTRSLALLSVIFLSHCAVIDMPFSCCMGFRLSIQPCLTGLGRSCGDLIQRGAHLDTPQDIEPCALPIGNSIHTQV